MKKVISALLGIIFVILVVVIVFVCTYVFSSPSKEGDSRQLIRGYWTDTENNVVLTLGVEGDFKMTTADEDESLIAKGYFKINEEDKKIKLFILPFDRDKSVDLGEQLGFFSTITYRDLEYPEEDTTAVAFRTTTEDDFPAATCKFIVSNSTAVYTCERTVTVTDFYDGTND